RLPPAPAALPAVLREVVVVRRLVVRLHRLRLEAVLIRRRHHRADAGIADEIPAYEAGVAAVVRIPERALVRVAEHHREKSGGAAGGTRRGAALDGGGNGGLIRRGPLLEHHAPR